VITVMIAVMIGAIVLVSRIEAREEKRKWKQEQYTEDWLNRLNDRVKKQAEQIKENTDLLKKLEKIVLNNKEVK